MTREETLSTSPRACILIDHPHAYREWTIVAVDSVPGFYHLEFSVRLDRFETTIYRLCLHESEFERI